MAQPRFQLVPGAGLSGGIGDGGVGWRLLGGNNRELGRSALPYSDAEAALAAVGRVRLLVASGDPHIVHNRVSSLWSWHLDDASVLIANSGRGFRHERECRYNLKQFRETAPTAPASDTSPLDHFPWQRSAIAVASTETMP